MEIATLSAIGSAVAAGATAAGAATAASSSKKARRSTTPAPKAQDTVQMPDEDDPAVREERERRMRERAMAGGRESTNLTGSADYSGTLLGG